MGNPKLRVLNTQLDNLIANLRGEVGEAPRGSESKARSRGRSAVRASQGANLGMSIHRFRSSVAVTLSVFAGKGFFGGLPLSWDYIAAA